MLSGRPALLPAILLAVQATAAPASPVVAQSGDQSVRAGAAFVAFVELDDPAAQVQWTRNGSPVAGASSAELVIDPVGTSNAASYQATVVSGGITRQSRPAQLEVTAQLLPPIGADQRGTVVIPGSLHHYDLYLPPGYSQGGTPMPIIFSDKGGAGGLVDQLRTVCREKRIILVDMSRCANGASWDTMAYMQRAILHDARQRLNFDPARLFVGGKSGGSWRSFDLAKGEASTVAERTAKQLEAVGTPAGEMTKVQRKALMKLVTEYANHYRKEIAGQELAKIRKAGVNNLRFGWAGSLKPGEAYYYRVQGPGVLIEAANTQNNANHIHTVWRDLDGDFGRDFLGDHSHGHE